MKTTPSKAAAGFLLALTLSTGCQSSSEKDTLDQTGAVPYVPLPDPEPAKIGYFLTQFDKSLQRWTELKLNATDERDIRTLRALERNMTLRASERANELVATLESGPRTNREVAAVALGFTEDPAYLSPLLSALSDPSEEVVQKALLGIGILSVPETPLSEIEYLLLHHPDPWTRNNAAFALQRIVAAGGGAEELAATCRNALIDEEPGVRAQAASTLGMMQDVQSVEPLDDLLYDDVELVATASASSLASIALAHQDVKGNVARALVDAMDRVEEGRHIHLQEELIRLSNKNYGDDLERWKEWAYRMP